VNCGQVRNLLHAYLDGELDLVRHLEIEQHLLDCGACAELHESNKTLRDSVRSEPLLFRAPPRLRERLQALPDEPAPRVPSSHGRRYPWPRLAALAAAILVLIGAVGILSPVLFRPPTAAADLLEREVLASHLRSLQVAHLTDVASSDRHTVRPWFTGKLDFSPNVKDLSREGFPLVGGRLDYLDNRAVAALVYQRRQHTINVFMWPVGPGVGEPANTQRQGYQLMHWVQSGMHCWAVSDLNPEELGQFVGLLQSDAANK
jgi:anti-sigma factor RsiW